MKPNKKQNKILIYLLSIFLVLFGYLFYITPGIKGDIEKSLKIGLNQPILFKTKIDTQSQKNLRLEDYPKKLFYALKNYFFSSNEFQKIKIDINFRELEKLKADRRKALYYRKLFNPQKVNVSILFDNKKYKATARLKGDLSEHWGNHKQWSLRIKLKNKKTILSMNEFALTVFEERAFPYNFVITDMFRENDILAPRYQILKTSVNGENWGLMLMEEQFSDSFYAFNKLKEAPIYKMTNENDFLIFTLAANKLENIREIVRWQGILETEIYNERNILKKTNIPLKNTNLNLFSIFKNFQEIEALRDEEYLDKLKNHVDYKLYAKITAILSAFGDYHGHRKTNSRYYLSPYDLQIQPIITDSTPSNIEKDKEIESFLSSFNYFFKILFSDKKFQNEYLKTLNYLHDNLFEIEKKFDEVCRPFGENCKSLVDIDSIEQNIIYFKNNLEIFDRIIDIKEDNSGKNFNTQNIQDLNSKKINFRSFDNGEVFVDNLTSENLEINKITLMSNEKCKNKCQKKEIFINYILEPSTFETLSSKKFKIKLSKKEKEKFKFLKISYLNENGKKYSLTERIENNNYIKTEFFKLAKIDLNENIKISGKTYIFDQGEHIIKKPIIVPDGNDLQINEGTKIKMLPNTYIMVTNGIVRFNGTKEKPIFISSIEKGLSWNGIYVNSKSNNFDKSSLNYVNLSDLNYFDNSKIQLTGGLNFVNSKVNLSNSIISNSFSEDAINLVNSKFNLQSVKIVNSKSDGIDIDFGEGKMINTIFDEIGGDAIDLSGSIVYLNESKIKNVEDKAISVGEATKLEAENIEISNSNIGIASKDSSKVNVKKVKISNCGLFDYAAYQKKSYFSGAYMKVDKSNSCKKSISQIGSELIINGEYIQEKKLNVKELYN